ncbi:MAG: SDR family NAD(P)-dependent oxidoreductase [Treponema sp.]|nr:SDR family NAD(P)-dependent oxidoreductase [Treponema sp.]
MSGSAKRIAVITGAAGGLGKEFVRQIIDDVDELWAIGRNEAKLEGLKAEFGSKIVPLQMDLSDTKSLSKLSKKIETEEKKSSIQIHWLINNAGAGRFGASKDFSTEEISVSVTTHCTAIAAICNICIPFMKAGDHIVNVSSQSAFSPLPYMNLYAATKAFVYSYTRALGQELRESGIVVTAVCPGWIQTALLPETLGGRKVKFPLIVTADKVAAKAIKDARRGKPLSIYRLAVRLVVWFQRHASDDFSVKFWANSVKKYL